MKNLEIVSVLAKVQTQVSSIITTSACSMLISFVPFGLVCILLTPYKKIMHIGMVTVVRPSIRDSTRAPWDEF